MLDMLAIRFFCSDWQILTEPRPRSFRQHALGVSSAPPPATHRSPTPENRNLHRGCTSSPEQCLRDCRTNKYVKRFPKKRGEGHKSLVAIKKNPNIMGLPLDVHPVSGEVLFNRLIRQHTDKIMSATVQEEAMNETSWPGFGMVSDSTRCGRGPGDAPEVPVFVAPSHTRLPNPTRKGSKCHLHRDSSGSGCPPRRDPSHRPSTGQLPSPVPRTALSRHD